MGTKTNPGKYDCYANAHPDEPYFMLLGRDPDAAILVRMWAMLREARGCDPEKVHEARQCAFKLENWCVDMRRDPTPEDQLLILILEKIIKELRK